MSDNPWPPDIYEGSWCRLPMMDRSELTEDASAIFDEHADPADRSHAGLRGPGGVRLHSSRLAESYPVGR